MTDLAIVRAILEQNSRVVEFGIERLAHGNGYTAEEIAAVQTSMDLMSACHDRMVDALPLAQREVIYPLKLRFDNRLKFLSEMLRSTAARRS